MFTANVGTWDRAIRIVVGLALIGLVATGTIGLWGLVGLVPLLTGLAGLCPLYSMLGIRTRGAARRHSSR